MYRNGQYTFQKLVTWSLPIKSLYLAITSAETG